MIILIFALAFSLSAAGADLPENNDFYDNNEFKALQGVDIEVVGEIVNPGKVDLTLMPLRSVNVSEAILAEKEQKFIGSYTYRGYSLFDILKERYLDKKNKKEFPPIIDLLVKVENRQGDKVIVSWGEIFYPTALHRIIIVTQAARIVPSKTKEMWPLPRKTKLVCADDLFTNRYIEHPSRITVFSASLHFKVDQGLKPLYSSSFDIYSGEERLANIDKLDKDLPSRSNPSVFYGRGKGYHGIRSFEGKLLKSLLAEYITLDPQNIMTGYWVVSAADGYRVTVSFAELCNRSDQKEFLIYDIGSGRDSGRFKLFPAADFFSDRAVKAISGIHFRRI